MNNELTNIIFFSFLERFIKRIGNLIFCITCYKTKELHEDDNHVFTEQGQHKKSEEASSTNIPG